MNNPVNIKEIPVSIFCAVSIIIIFSLYTTTVFKEIPCGKDVMSIFYSNFVHIDIYHLVSNVLALYALSRVEVAIGGKKFVALIVFLLVFNTIMEVVINSIFKTLPCSIGFSGVLFGIATWELVTKKGLDWVVALSIVIMLVGPSIKNPKASFLGHIVGVISGVVGGLIVSKIPQFS